MKFYHLIMASAAILLQAGPAHAANVLFVDNETPHSSWQTLIESGGHSFTLFDTSANNLSLNNQASIDYVEGFDLIVMSGSNPAFNAVRSHGATWNTLTIPMINMGNFLASGQFGAGSWQWTTPTTGGTANSSGDVDVLDPADPVWSGVTITAGTPGTADLFAGNAGHLTLGTDSLLGGITLVAAQSSDNGSVAIARAAPGALRSGSQEQYFIAGMTGGTQNPVNFNDDGQQVFLNAIQAIAIPEPSAVLLGGLGLLMLLRRRRIA